MKNIFVLLIISVVAVACNPEKKYKTELDTIANQKMVIDSLKTVFNNIDFDSLYYFKEKASEYEQIVKEKYNADTINTEFASMMNNMKSVRKSLASLDKNKRSAEKEIEALNEQFSDLETDIRNGVLNKDQITTFLNDENKALEKFIFNFKAIHMNHEKQKEKFYLAKPVVDSFVTLMNKN